jgi:hypothetical protein
MRSAVVLPVAGSVAPSAGISRSSNLEPPSYPSDLQAKTAYHAFACARLAGVLTRRIADSAAHFLAGHRGQEHLPVQVRTSVLHRDGLTRDRREQAASYAVWTIWTVRSCVETRIHAIREASLVPSGHMIADVGYYEGDLAEDVSLQPLDDAVENLKAVP